MYTIRKGIRSKIAHAAGITEAQCWRRLSELERKGFIEKTGRTFISNTTGKSQEEWQLVGTPEK